MTTKYGSFSTVVISIVVLLVLECSSQLLNREPNGQDPNVIFPLVTTFLGKLHGVTSRSRSGKLYYSFYGIPFAQPPSRFQRCTNGVSNNTHLLPVIFNIHGGAYKAGTGSIFGGKFFLDECIVFVSINYRLGALGFLSTGDNVIPGNLGLKDQVLALHWTKLYISSFRGDPNLVTIVGMSAGGSSVSHHVTSPMSKSLFHRAIAASGTALAPWSVQRNPHLYAQRLGLALNCPAVTPSSALRSCLESKSFSEIITKQDPGDGSVVHFGPTLEPSETVFPFQTIHPAVRLRDGNFNKVPFMTGFAEDEGISILAGFILSASWVTDLVNKNWATNASLWFLYDQLNMTQEENTRITNEIYKFYFGEKPVGEETRQNLTNLYSDRYFVQNAFETVELHSKFAPAYSYVVTYKGGPTGAAGVGYEIPAVTHGDDAQYLFGTSQSQYGTEQYDFSVKLIKHWVNFAVNGSPSTSNDEGDWHISTGRSNDQWHQLDTIEQNLGNYLEERRHFWQNLGLYQYEFWS